MRPRKVSQHSANVSPVSKWTRKHHSTLRGALSFPLPPSHSPSNPGSSVFFGRCRKSSSLVRTCQAVDYASLTTHCFRVADLLLCHCVHKCPKREGLGHSFRLLVLSFMVSACLENRFLLVTYGVSVILGTRICKYYIQASAERSPFSQFQPFIWIFPQSLRESFRFKQEAPRSLCPPLRRSLPFSQNPHTR